MELFEYILDNYALVVLFTTISYVLFVILEVLLIVYLLVRIIRSMLGK